jgi:hypothetical protein
MCSCADHRGGQAGLHARLRCDGGTAGLLAGGQHRCGKRLREDRASSQQG